MTKITKPAIPEPGSLTWPFRLGDKVKDKLTGEEGFATARCFHVSGCDTFLVTMPRNPHTGKAVDENLDGHRLELVEARPEFHRNEIPEIGCKLGDKVKAILSGVTGYVGIIFVPITGSIRVDVSPEWDAKEKKMPEGFLVDHAFVQVVEAYKPTQVEPPRERGCMTLSTRRAS